MKLYFFPAFLPLVEVLPWLLTAFGALAGFLLGTSARRFGKRTLWAARIVSLVALLGFCWFAAPRVYWWWHRDDSLATPAAELPKRETLGAAVADHASPPATYKPGAWHESWSVHLPRRALSAPFRVGDLLVFGTWDATVDAYSIANGSPVWKLQKKGPVFALAVPNPDLLLAGEGLHEATFAGLTAVRLPSGEALWQREFQGHIESAPAFADGRIFLGAGPSGLWSLSASDGSVLWHARVGHVDCTPLVADGLVLFGSQPDESKMESVFWAADAASGKTAWSLPFPGQPWGSPQRDPATGFVLLSTGIGQVGVIRADNRGWAHAISLDDHHAAWTTELPGNPIEMSVLFDGLAIYTLTKGMIVALHARDGKEAWRLELPGPVQADPSLDPVSGTITATGADGLVSFVDARKGRLLETRRFDAGTNSAPLFLPDGVVIATPYHLTRFHW